MDINIKEEVIELADIKDDATISLNKVDSPKEINLNDNDSVSKSGENVNFGGGIELLMNTSKHKNGGNNTNDDIKLDDLGDLEKELNELTQDKPPSSGENKPNSFFGNVKSLFSSDNDTDKEKTESTNFEPVSLGKSTANTGNSTKTKDGFGIFNNIPLDPDKSIEKKPKMSQEEILMEKFKVLNNLNKLEDKGVRLSKKYTMESSLYEMKGEYEMLMSEREKKNSVNFQRQCLMSIVTGLEYLNTAVNPFDVQLDGWGEQVNENIDSYDEIFEELHEKYKSKAKLAPEIKLLFQLAGSGMMVHMSNAMLKNSSIPGVDEIMRQNPELMQQFVNSAMNTMGKTNPGLSGLMGELTSGQQSRSRPPPSPVPTSRPNSTTRPEMKGPGDISDLIAGLRTKQKPSDDDSNVSIQDLKQQSYNKGNKKSNKRRKSEKTSISLDI